MATSPQVQGLGSIYSGMAASGTIPRDILQSGMADLGKLAYLTRTISPFDYLIHRRFGAKKVVKNTREFKVTQISALDRTYQVTVASTTTGSRTVFGVPNAQAAQIKENDILFLPVYIVPQGQEMLSGQVLPGTNTAAGPILGSPVGMYVSSILFSREFGRQNASGYVFTSREQVKVIAVGQIDSAGIGHSNITVERCWSGPSGQDFGGAIFNRATVSSALTTNAADTNSAALIAGDIILRGAPSFKEGTGAPEGLHKNVEIDSNFSQEIKYAVEMTKEMSIEATWISEKPMDINRWLVNERRARDMEYMHLFGKKGVFTDTTGKKEYTTGGVIEFIPPDADHIINYPSNSLNYAKMLDFTKSIAVLGGSEEKWMFCGYSLEAKMKAQWYESGLMRLEPQHSKDFNLEVNSIQGTGVKINIVSSQIMEEAGWGMRGLCLDLNLPSFTPVTHKDYDWKIENNGGKGVQAPDMQTYKEYAIGIVGLERRYSDYHTIIDFKNVS